MTDAELLTAYRHAKALAGSLERLLRERGTIKCTQCGLPHKIDEPHRAKPINAVTILSARVEVSG